jgi:hypothetical protein
MATPSPDGAIGKADAARPEIRIFLCSSVDMLPERRVALRVIHEIAEMAGDRALITAYRWEDEVRNFRSDLAYQHNIPLPESFDIFLGFLHSRIGTQLSAETYRALLAGSLTALRDLGAEADTDAEALSLLGERLPSEALPSGTTFEIRNALDGAQRRPGASSRPVCWLAMNNAGIEALHSRDPTIAGPARRAWEEVGAFRQEISARTAFMDYGEGRQRQEQLRPNGLAEFQDMLRAWLTATLRDTFGLALRWSGRRSCRALSSGSSTQPVCTVRYTRQPRIRWA